MRNIVISIIIPTLNEEKNLPKALKSIKKVDYPQKNIELIIVDGGSTDKTIQIAKESGAKIFNNPRKIRGAGCQIGVKQAEGEFIAFTDADCVVPKNWLKDLLINLEDEDVASVGGPNITPKDDTDFAKASGEVIAILTKPGSRYGYFGKNVTETYHNPGCNVLYKKDAILKVGNFNPELLTCEDEELDFRLLKEGYRLLFTPKVIVDHYRRPTYKKLFIQAYRFAIGRAQAIKMYPKMARWFHFVPSIMLLSVVGIFPSLFLFLSISVYLSMTKKHAPFYVYFRLFLCWFFGWSFGFTWGFFKVPKNLS